MSHNGSESDHKTIESIAYHLWEERGRLIGSPEEDWFCAEQQLRENAGAPESVTLPSAETILE